MYTIQILLVSLIGINSLLAGKILPTYTLEEIRLLNQGPTTSGGGAKSQENLNAAIETLDSNSGGAEGVLSVSDSTSRADRYIKEFNGITYTLMRQDGGFIRTNQLDGVRLCKNASLHLLSIKSKNESDFVTNWLYNEIAYRNVWLSLKRVDDSDDFIWPDGETIKFRDNSSEAGFQNWHACEPNHRTSTGWGFPEDWDENCVQMRPAFRHGYPDNYTLPHPCDSDGKAGEWNDIPCNELFSIVVCQSAP